MKYFYGQFNGEGFPEHQSLFGFDQLMQFIMQHGEQALKAIEQMMNHPENDHQSDLIEQLIQDGMLDKDAKGKLRLTPRAVTKMQRKALLEVFANLRDGAREGHEKITAGQGGERIEGTKPYQYGDPVSELDLHQTIHNALTRHGLPNKGSGFGVPERVQGSGFGVQEKKEEKEPIPPSAISPHPTPPLNPEP